MAWFDWLNPAMWVKAFQATPTEPHYGADFAASQVSQPSATEDMAAYAAFPWVFACASAIINDLSGLPLIATVGEGKDAKRLDKHPALSVISSHLRRQMVLDHALTGNAYGVILHTVTGGKTPGKCSASTRSA